MKKTNKVVGLATLVLTVAGLAACGGKGGDKPGTSSKCSHTYQVVEAESKAATCTEGGVEVKKCSKCGNVTRKDVKAKGHDMKEDTTAAGYKAATCTEGGVSTLKCAREGCNETETKNTEPLGHDMQDLGETATGYVAPTCQAEGTMPQKCGRAGCDATDTRTLDKVDHDWGEVVWSTPVSCEEDGVGTKTCKNCPETENVEQEKLGHKPVLVGDETEPEEGKAKVRMFSCENECGQTFLGFKASEVSTESKKHLVINDEGGARFWGRPIGNDVALDEEGSADRDNHEAVFNENQPGDFFEYIFDLTKEQAESLGDCMLYCDATAAQYMSNNRMDFWACREGDEDWTRGMYVETTETHEKGTDIDTYRYILYVDDQPKDFDPTISVPAKSNTVRTDYVMPYTFKLHEGTNKIRLVMAGGYRSVFYNFTFRSVKVEEKEEEQEQPHVHAFNEGKCECGAERIVVNAGANEGSKMAQGGKLPKPYDGSNPIKWKVNMAEAQKVKLSAKVFVDNASNWTEENGYSYRTGKNGGSNAIKELPDNKTNTSLKVNGVAVAMPTTTYYEMGIRGTTADKAGIAEYGEFDFVQGENTFEMAALDSYGLCYQEFYLTIEKPNPHTHNMTAGDKAEGSALRALSCPCGITGYELKAADLTSGHKNPATSGQGSTEKNTRLGKGEMDDVWSINGIAAGKYALYLEARASQGNDVAGYWSSATAIANGGRPTDNGSTPELQADFKYKVKIDGGEYTNIGPVEDNYAASGLNTNTPAWTTKALCEITVAEGAQTLTIHNMDNGYSIWVYAARLVKIA